MRVALIALVLAGCGDALVSGEAPPRCPRPCPSACPDACQPTGFCGVSELTFEAAGVSTAVVLGETRPMLTGLPPNVAVTLEIDATMDLAERDAVPWPWGLGIAIDRVRSAFDRGRVAETAFPVPIRWSAPRTTDENGRISFYYEVHACDGSGPSTCVFQPGSVFRATVLDPAPWSEAPLCND